MGGQGWQLIDCPMIFFLHKTAPCNLKLKMATGTSSSSCIEIELWKRCDKVDKYGMP